MVRNTLICLVLGLNQVVLSVQTANGQEPGNGKSILTLFASGKSGAHLKLRSAGEVDAYLRAILTPERLRLFCVHETRWIHPIQCLVPKANRWEGQLYSSEESGVGRVTWSANVLDGCAERCSVRVDTGNGVDYWYMTFLEDFPSRTWQDGDFLKMRIKYILDSSLMLYNLYHQPPTKLGTTNSWWWNLKMLSCSKLFTQKGQIFLSQFNNRKEILRVKLADNYKIEYVLVNNKRSKEWDKVLSAYDKNLNRLNLEH